jgi:hypothetical protein
VVPREPDRAAGGEPNRHPSADGSARLPEHCVAGRRQNADQHDTEEAGGDEEQRADVGHFAEVVRGEGGVDRDLDGEHGGCGKPQDQSWRV